MMFLEDLVVEDAKDGITNRYIDVEERKRGLYMERKETSQVIWLAPVFP